MRAKLRWISASLYLGQRILRVDKSSTMRRTSPWQPNWASRRQDLTSQSRWTVDARHNGGRRGLNSPWPWSTETSPQQEGSCFLNIIPSLSHYSSLSTFSSLPTNKQRRLQMQQMLLQKVQEEGLHQRCENALLLARRFGHRCPHHWTVNNADDAGRRKEEKVSIFGS